MEIRRNDEIDVPSNYVDNLHKQYFDFVRNHKLPIFVGGVIDFTNKKQPKTLFFMFNKI